MTNLVTDVRIALRLWKRRPGLPLAVILTLTAGLGVAIGVFVVAWVGNAPALGPAIRRVVAAADPRIPIGQTRTLEDRVADAFARERLMARLLSGLGLAGVALAMMGLVAVVHHQVHRSRRDIAIRMALGATSGSVVRALASDGARLAAIGALAGGVISIGTGGLLASLLFGVAPGDPVTLGTVAVLIVALACLAAWLPARSAARVDPAAALRT